MARKMFVIAALIVLAFMAVVISQTAEVPNTGQKNLDVRQSLSPQGAVPELINYQGVLTDNNTGAFMHGSYDLTFRMYDAETAGALIWSELHSSVPVDSGLFQVLLGDGTSVGAEPYPALSEAVDGTERWLEVEVGGQAMVPLQRIASVAYALLSGDGGDGHSLDAADGSPVDVVYVDDDGNVGIGTTTPGAPLEVKSSSGNDPLILGIQQTGVGDLLYLRHGADKRFVVGQTGNTSIDVYGSSPALTVDADGGDILRLMDAGNIEAVVQKDGDVGIGTANPMARLHIKGSAIRDCMMFIQGLGGESNAGIRIDNQGGTHLIYDDVTESHDLVIESGLQRDIIFRTTTSGGVEERMRITSLGYIGMWTDNPSYAHTLTVRGNVLIQSESSGDPVVELGEGLDYAEGFNISDDEEIHPGTVLSIDPDNPGELTVSEEPYDTRVAGIVAGGKGVGSGIRLAPDQFDYDVALAGRVYCNVDARFEGVEPGDLLTTSSTPGYAMRASDYESAQGAILGKAMEKLEKGTKGQILVLVTLQ